MSEGFVPFPGPEYVIEQTKHAAIRANNARFEETHDRLGIRHTPTAIADCDQEFIRLPKDYPEVVDFEIAREPPTVDFMIIQDLEPWYLPINREMNRDFYHPDGTPLHSGFGDVARGPDGCYYFAIGNHMYVDGMSYIVRYDPETRSTSLPLDTRKVISREEGAWAEGKIHGDPSMDPEGNMWLGTMSGPRPLPDDIDQLRYRGGHLLRFNVLTGEAEDLGIPFESDSWAYFTHDWQRHTFFAIGQARGCIMAYDTRERRLIFGGYPPKDVFWYRRANLLDADTGRIYSHGAPFDQMGKPTSDHYPMIYWERQNNRFTKTSAETPPHPVTGVRSQMRAYTRKKDNDGAFWCFDYFGGLFRFFTAEERVESVGVNWGRQGFYTANIRLSPDRRYLYFIPDSHYGADRFGTPVVQLDLVTRKKKVLAFLADFYLSKYGYAPFGTFGIELDEKGESLFCYMNGQFTSRELGGGFGRPSVFHIHIPASERPS